MDQLIQEFKELGCKEVITTVEQYNDVKDNYKYYYKIPVKVIAKCGHEITISLYTLNAKIDPICIICENKDFAEDYEKTKNMFEDIGETLVTTFEQFLQDNMKLRESTFKVQMSKCGHLRDIRFYDLKAIDKEKRYCTPCIRKLKNNGKLPYEELVERFNKIDCTLVTTEEQYKTMTSRSEFIFNCKCGKPMTGIPANMSFKTKKYCSLECKRTYSTL